MTTTEKNEIIARFMGYESNEDIEGEFDESTLYNVDDFLVNTSGKNDWETTENDWTSWVKPSEMQYHSDWNWLHQVISKIEDFYTINGEEIEFRVVQYEDEVLIVAKYQLKRWENIVEVLSSGDGKLKNTYEAVYQFIVWYNQNKENESTMP